MANTSRIFGLKPIRSATSGHYVGQTIKCFIPASDATDTYVNDAVVIAGDANPALVPNYPEQVEGAYASVRQAAAGEAIYGVIAGFEPLAVVGYEQTMYRKGGTAMYVNVIVDPNVEYEIQAKTGTAMTRAAVNQTCNISVDAPDPIYGKSGMQADLATLGNAAANQLLILGLQDRAVDNELGDVAKLRVKINASGFTASGVTGG